MINSYHGYMNILQITRERTSRLMKIRDTFYIPSPTVSSWIDREAAVARLDNLACDLECWEVLQRPLKKQVISEKGADEAWAVYNDDCFRNV